MRYKGLILLLSGLLLGILLGLLIFRSSPLNNSTTGARRLPPTIGSPVKDFQLYTLDTELVSLKDNLFQPVVINFWATWCGPCKEEMPLLEKLSKQYSNQVTFIGVNSGEDQDTVKQFLAKQDINFLILLDQAGNVTDDYFVKNFPMTFFVDKDGILQVQQIGLLTDEKARQYLKAIGVEP